jgi:ornithine cyclodeaminase
MPKTIRVLSAEDVEKVTASMKVQEAMLLMAKAFSHFTASNAVDLPHRTSIQTSNHTTLIMPAYAGLDGGASVKVVAVPKHGSGGLPATVLVMDEEDGGVKAIVNARTLTALRTAAGSALVTKAFYDSRSPKHLVCFGAGLQIYYHAHLLLDLFTSMVRCTIVNRKNNKRLSNVVQRLQSNHPQVDFQTIVTEGSGGSGPEVQAAVQNADIICTATSSTTPLFDGAWIKPNAHINLIGSYTPEMQEVDEKTINRASIIIVDSKDASSKEAGELIQQKVMTTRPQRVLEVGEFLNEDGRMLNQDNYKKIEPPAGDLTIFKSVGIAVQDVSIATHVTEKAEQMGLGSLVLYE